MLGEKLRTGVVRIKDEVLKVDQLLLIGNISEKDRINSNSEEERKKL